MANHTAGEQELFLRFAHEIERFYQERFFYKRSCATPRFPTVDIIRAPVRIYLRFLPGEFGPEDSVVIANIEFRDRRRGYGTELLAKLVEMSCRYGLNSIGIEQTGLDESIQIFVRKFGFENHVNKRNWLISVENLRARLEALPRFDARRKRGIDQSSPMTSIQASPSSRASA